MQKDVTKPSSTEDLLFCSPGCLSQDLSITVQAYREELMLFENKARKSQIILIQISLLFIYCNFLIDKYLMIKTFISETFLFTAFFLRSFAQCCIFFIILEITFEEFFYLLSTIESEHQTLRRLL